MTRDTLTDYTAIIRGQIERDVAMLKGRLRVTAQYAEIGYLVNTHHGLPIYADGDVVCGLSVRISPYPRIVRVGGESHERDRDGERIVEHEQTIW